MAWTRAWEKTASCGQCLSKSLILPSCRHSHDHSIQRLSVLPRVPGTARASTSHAIAPSPTGQGSSGARYLSEASAARARKRSLNRDFILSVLELSATKRDAKGYLQKYTSNNPTALAEAPQFVQGDEQQHQLTAAVAPEPLHVAITKLRAPQEIDSDTLRGVATTLVQLRRLGLVSLVVVDCGLDEHRLTFHNQVFRLCKAISSLGEPGAREANNLFSYHHTSAPTDQSILGLDINVDDPGFIDQILSHGMIPVIPALISRDETRSPQPVDANKVVLALTKYLAGLQFEGVDDPVTGDSKPTRPNIAATVERIILLDPLGAIPHAGRPGACHRYINIEQEFDGVMKDLQGPDGFPLADERPSRASVTAHAANLALAKDALSMLPSTASALVTTPYAAANITRPAISNVSKDGFVFSDMVTTRRKKNPLLHNLLTDKPAFSSSLPIPVSQSYTGPEPVGESATASTLIKRGMPLTIFPPITMQAWSPPKPGGPRLRLTDNCIDLPRLVHLIEDSFNRKLDVQDYLNRVNDNLAGIIIAGEYEGGAILTWERPNGLSEQEAYEQGRLVPYLDKFAVLKKSQGSGGVADVVFNAMVRGCFPNGVCWRSRKDNPVNKWYFERSAGTQKLSDCNWTMFWTTPGLDNENTTIADYESICRSVEPSWADNKHILD